MTASTAIADDVDALSSSLDGARAAEAFTSTWEQCSNPRLPCPPQPRSDANATIRHDLADAVRARGRAARALAQAYGALREEADYDGRADLQGATLAAAKAVDDSAAAIAKVAPVGAIAGVLSQPIVALVGEGGALIGQDRQRRRLIRASRVIGATTERLRVVLQAEAGVFDTIASYLQGQRTQGQLAFFDAGLASGSDLIAPVARDLDVRLGPGADDAIARSPAARAALRASLEASSQAEVDAVGARYRAAIAALGALASAHADLEARRPVSVADVERTLAELDDAVQLHQSEEVAR